MMRLFLASLATVLSCATIAGAMTANANVNVSITPRSETFDYISEVVILGTGGGTLTFSDFQTAPSIATPEAALFLASIGLGLLPTTPLTAPTLEALPPFTEFEEIVTSNLNPRDNPGLVIGNPGEYTTWIATGTMDVNVEVEQVTYFLNPYRLTASIIPDMTAVTVPLPAGLGFGLLGLAALGVLRRNRADVSKQTMGC